MVSGRCGACKHLKKKCEPDCIFAPYFPANDPLKFVCVHRIFGASNAGKMLQEIPPQLREDAAKSMYSEAKCWIEDPVNGCCGIIEKLHNQVRALTAHLAKIEAEIAILNQGNLSRI